MENLQVKFWGTRGSVPSPLTPVQVEAKIIDILLFFAQDPKELGRLGSRDQIKEYLYNEFTFAQRSTFGGNTTCVEIRSGESLIILDMGTGIRELGLSLMSETIANKGIHGTILQSHVHWDHVHGFPFFPQLYLPRKHFDNSFQFFGGKDWDKSLDDVLRGQMNPPMFPVDHRELEKTGMHMDFNTIWDGKEIYVYPDGKYPNINILARKLNHPQETYGYRIEAGNKSIAFCTDHEPYAALHKPLIELAKDVDIFITDCQYTYHEYIGAKGVPKLGWGHSYPEYIAQIAQEAKCKLIVTTHHDPGASDEHIVNIAAEVEKLSGIPTMAAYEGLVL